MLGWPEGENSAIGPVKKRVPEHAEIFLSVLDLEKRWPGRLMFQNSSHNKTQLLYL